MTKYNIIIMTIGLIAILNFLVTILISDKERMKEIIKKSIVCAAIAIIIIIIL